jgi:hypothetical protein
MVMWLAWGNSSLNFLIEKRCLSPEIWGGGNNNFGGSDRDYVNCMQSEQHCFNICVLLPKCSLVAKLFSHVNINTNPILRNENLTVTPLI